MKKVLMLCVLIVLVFSMASLAGAEESTVKSRINKISVFEDAPVVALYVYLDPNGVSDPVKSSESIFNDLKEELDKKQVNVVPFDKSQRILRNYIRENSSAETTRDGDKGFVPKKKDLSALAAEAGADYVMYVDSRVTDQKIKYNLWSGIRAQQTLIIEVPLIDKNAEEYIIDEMYSEAGSGSFASYDRAFNKALPKLLDQIDLSSVNFKKIEK